jgi:hypothetical protein
LKRCRCWSNVTIELGFRYIDTDPVHYLIHGF